MKKIIFLLFSLITLFSFSTKGAYADTGSDVIKRFESDIQISNSVTDKLTAEKDPNAKIQILTNELPNLISHYNDSSTFYLQLANSSTNDNEKTLLQRLSTTTKNLSNNSTDIQQAIQNNDNTAYETALTNYDNSIAEMNGELKDVNAQYASTYDWLPWAFWFTLITSGILFIISRGNPVLPAEKLRNQFEFALFKSSLWPFGGAAISYGWQLITPPGQTYYVLTWLIAIGYIQFARGLYAYIRYSRPAIELAKKEQQNKLEKLITSEQFIKGDEEEKAEEVEELSSNTKSEEIYCEKCGTKNLSKSKYCKKCGNKF